MDAIVYLVLIYSSYVCTCSATRFESISFQKSQFVQNGTCQVSTACSLQCSNGLIFSLQDIATVNSLGIQQRYLQALENSTIYSNTMCEVFYRHIF